MAPEVSRRDFLTNLGVTVTAAAAGTAAGAPLLSRAERADAQEVKGAGKIPDTPYKVGHMTFHTGPGAVLGEPMYKGHILAAEEINVQGGLLGKRKIETIKADEAAGTDANVKEVRRMKLSEKIDFFTGITSSGNTPALGPVSEELKLLTVFVDGCTDFLFDKAVPNPHYIFRITNMQSADGVTGAVAAAMTWPKTKKIAHIHPDYSYGRNAFDHVKIVMKKLMPQKKSIFSDSLSRRSSFTLASVPAFSSALRISIFRLPSRPPCALISSAASSCPLYIGSPRTAAAPVKNVMWPILKGVSGMLPFGLSWAWATPTEGKTPGSAVSAVPTVTPRPDRKSRRFTSAMCVLRW